AVVVPLLDAVVADRGIRQFRNPGDADAALTFRVANPRPTAGCRPPALAERRGADHSDDRHAVDGEGDEGRPDRNAAQVVGGAVNRVDDPLTGRVAFAAELLTQDGVLAAIGGEPGPDGLFDGLIGVGDRGAVRLG